MSDITPILYAAHFAALKHSNKRRKHPDATPSFKRPRSLARVQAEEGSVKGAATWG